MVVTCLVKGLMGISLAFAQRQPAGDESGAADLRGVLHGKGNVTGRGKMDV